MYILRRFNDAQLPQHQISTISHSELQTLRDQTSALGDPRYTLHLNSKFTGSLNNTIMRKSSLIKSKESLSQLNMADLFMDHLLQMTNPSSQGQKQGHPNFHSQVNDQGGKGNVIMFRGDSSGKTSSGLRNSCRDEAKSKSSPFLILDSDEGKKQQAPSALELNGQQRSSDYDDKGKIKA